MTDCTGRQAETQGINMASYAGKDEIIVIVFFQLTVYGGVGEHGIPAPKDVTGACRPQPGLFLNKPRMEGVPVLGSP